MTDPDQIAHSAHDLVTEIASRQVSREIAHLAEIEVDSHGVHAVERPTGHHAPASGVITTHVIARSRDVPEAITEMRVAVWVTDDDAAPGVLLTRADSDRTLAIAADELEGEVGPQLHARVNDYVALIIAQMVSDLNVAMQRSYSRDSGGDVAEYDPS